MNLKIKPNRRDALLLMSLLLVIILLKLPSLFEPHWYSDEGFYSSGANTLKYEKVLYKDIYTSLNPGIFYFFSITNFSPTLNLVIIKILNLLVTLGSAVFIYKIAKKLFTRKIAYAAVMISIVFLGLPIIDTNIVTLENLFLFLSLAGVYFGLKGTTKSMIASGLLFGVSFFVSFKTIFDLLALLIYIFLKKDKGNYRWKSFILLLSGLFIPLIIFTYYLTTQNIFNSFHQLVIKSNIDSIINTESSSNTLFFFKNTFIFRSLLTVSLIGLIIYLYLRCKISSKSVYLSVWATLSLYSVLLYQKPYLHFFIQIIPIFGIITALLIRKLKNDQDCLIRLYTIAMFLLSVSFIFNLFAKGQKITSNVNCLNYYINFIRYLTRQIDTTSYIQFFGNNTYETYRLRNYLSQNFPDEDNIYIWTDNPWIYKLANINPPTRYLQNYEAVNNLEITKIDLDLSNPYIIIINEDSQVSEYIENYIFDNNYEFYREFENYRIYIREGKNIANE